MTMIDELDDEVDVAGACAAVGLPRSTYYRRKRGAKRTPARPLPEPQRKLYQDERQCGIDVLTEARFVDWAPIQVWAQLMEEGTYLCSPRTMHRILSENVPVRDRRDQLRHPAYAAPQLLTTKPNELWSWDITKLLGPQKWTYYYLYVILDVFSRDVVGWLIAERESGALARELVDESCRREGIEPGQLTVHSDRGSPMKSKTLGNLYVDLGITKSFSRPHVSNDNPFIESHFKTLKYRPEFPERFGSLEHARSCVHDLIEWYRHEHHHSSLEYLTPHDVHYGLADQRLAERDAVMQNAYEAPPERFVHGPPKKRQLARAVWINPPKNTADAGVDQVKNETEPEGSAPSVSSPAQRSGCSSAEPYPPNRHADSTPHPVRPQSDKPRGVGQSPAPNQGAPLAVPH